MRQRANADYEWIVADWSRGHSHVRVRLILVAADWPVADGCQWSPREWPAAMARLPRLNVLVPARELMTFHCSLIRGT